MSNYEQRLASDKNEIRHRVVNVGRSAESAVAAAVRGLLERDAQLCYQTMLGDLPINREVRAIDKLCHAFVARHLPSAGHLRFVSSALRMNVALERIGDYAVTIAREAVQLTRPVPDLLASDIRELARQACEVLRNALLAFSERDVELARQTRPRARSVERTYAQLHQHLTQKGAELPLPDAFGLLMVFHRLERVNDQAQNISEETLFELTGEMKPLKPYRILFVDDDGARLAPLAEALARKAFPQSGSYTSAGFAPAGRLSTDLERLARDLPLDLKNIAPRGLVGAHDELEAYDVIVTLTPNAYERIGNVPYGTVLLSWTVPLHRHAVDSYALLGEAGRELAVNIRDLMVLIRGDDAH